MRKLYDKNYNEKWMSERERARLLGGGEHKFFISHLKRKLGLVFTPNECEFVWFAKLSFSI